MEVIKNIDPMTWMILVASMLIIIFVLISKVIEPVVKIAVIVVMLIGMLYFLRQAGAF